jgi:hypothetical protein
VLGAGTVDVGPDPQCSPCSEVGGQPYGRHRPEETILFKVLQAHWKEAEAVAFGIRLSSTRTVWMNQARLEVVSNTVPPTGTSGLKVPANLDFSK